MKCLACNQEVTVISNRHLGCCCGLTVQEYALRYGQSMDVLVPAEQLNQADEIERYPRNGAVNRDARITLASLQMSGMVHTQGDFAVIPGEVRKLDQLLWLAECLHGYGFRFRQEYIFNQTTHRVVAVNHLKARRENVPAEPIDYGQMQESDLLLTAAVLMAVNGHFYGGYVFLELQNEAAVALVSRFTKVFGVGFVQLKNMASDTCLLRAETLSDSNALLNLLKPRLTEIPHADELYYQPQPTAMVAKELVFDAAHFITDHPGKCANLHGGRYNVLVKVRDRINPISGFVVDYGYLKAIVKQRVIERLDHSSLNLADATLSWRSSTELLNLFIWEQLIDYLPNLYELQTYETPQSYCSFRGPSLDIMQQQGGHIVTPYFQSEGLGSSELRRRSEAITAINLKVVGKH